jgi:ketosteroid isomerase-like protein
MVVGRGKPKEMIMTDHIEAVRKFYEVFSSGDVSGFDDILSKDWQPLPAVPGNPGGRDGQKSTVHYLRSVLANLSYKVKEITPVLRTW